MPTVRPAKSGEPKRPEPDLLAQFEAFGPRAAKAPLPEILTAIGQWAQMRRFSGSRDDAGVAHIQRAIRLGASPESTTAIVDATGKRQSLAALLDEARPEAWAPLLSSGLVPWAQWARLRAFHRSMGLPADSCSDVGNAVELAVMRAMSANMGLGRPLEHGPVADPVACLSHFCERHPVAKALALEGAERGLRLFSTESKARFERGELPLSSTQVASTEHVLSSILGARAAGALFAGPKAQWREAAERQSRLAGWRASLEPAFERDDAQIAAALLPAMEAAIAGASTLHVEHRDPVYREALHHGAWRCLDAMLALRVPIGTRAENGSLAGHSLDLLSSAAARCGSMADSPDFLAHQERFRLLNLAMFEELRGPLGDGPARAAMESALGARPAKGRSAGRSQAVAEALALRQASWLGDATRAASAPKPARAPRL